MKEDNQEFKGRRHCQSR